MAKNRAMELTRMKVKRQTQEYGVKMFEASLYNDAVLGEAAKRHELAALVAAYDGPVVKCGVGYAGSVAKPKTFTKGPRVRDQKRGDWRLYYKTTQETLIKG